MPAREEILARLKSAKREKIIQRPPVPDLLELKLNKEEMLERFISELKAQTGVVHNSANVDETLGILKGIATDHGLKKIIASNDETIKSLDLKSWGSKNGVDVSISDDFSERESFRKKAFEADAGITSADFAIAETGTLGISISKVKPRLVSIATSVHIAILPISRLHAVYETALESVFAKGADYPSQFCFITGPSSSSDIQGVHFKGMHGPTKVFVIFVH